jgi:hypothetical protein
MNKKIYFAGAVAAPFKESNMSKQHKGQNRNKWSSGSSMQAKTEVPVASNITQSRNYKETSADRQGRNPVTSELKHHHGSCVDSNKGDGSWQQAGPPDENRRQSICQDGNIGEKEQASSASHLVEDQASSTQMEHSAQSEYEELSADGSVTSAFGTSLMSFLCKCLECQHCNPILKEMIDAHPKKDYYIGLLKQQHAGHEEKHNVKSKGLSPCAAEFKPPQQKNSDIQAVCDSSSAKNQPSSSFSVVVSRIHVLLLIRCTKSQASFKSLWLLKLFFVVIFSENIVIKSLYCIVFYFHPFLLHCNTWTSHSAILVYNLQSYKHTASLCYSRK